MTTQEKGKIAVRLLLEIAREEKLPEITADVDDGQGTKWKLIFKKLEKEEQS